MKFQFYPIFLIVCLIIICLSCKKKSENPIDDLPPVTTTGANTFGCLVNGELFIPKVNFGPRAALEGSYGVEKGQTFLGVTATNNHSKGTKNILIFVSTEVLKQGQEYDLIKNAQNNSSASYSYVASNITEYKTNNEVSGKVYITYLDKKIASGKFWFNAVSDSEEKVEIREGRFDIKL